MDHAFDSNSSSNWQKLLSLPRLFLICLSLPLFVELPTLLLCNNANNFDDYNLDVLLTASIEFCRRHLKPFPTGNNHCCLRALHWGKLIEDDISATLSRSFYRFNCISQPWRSLRCYIPSNHLQLRIPELFFFTTSILRSAQRYHKKILLG